MHDTLEFVLRHGYWVLFVWVLAEQFGVPIPSPPILLGMGALAGFGERSPGTSMALRIDFRRLRLVFHGLQERIFDPANALPYFA